MSRIDATFAAFQSRNYALFWSGSFVSNVGTWMQSIALGWLIYDITHSASWLGSVSFASNAPMLFVGLLGGAVADRADHKLVLVGTRAVSAVTALVLAALTYSGALQTWEVIALALASGAALSLYTPVMHAMIPGLVPSEHLLNAVSLNSVQFNLARILGPVVAGFAYSRIGPGGCFVINGLSSFVLCFALAQLRLAPQAPPPPTSIRQQLVEGLAFAASEPLIVAMLVLAAAVSLFGFPYIILMPAVARDTMHLGPEGLGVMMGSVGLGAVVGGLGLASVGDVTRKGLLALAAGSALAAFLVGFSLAPTLSVAVPTLFLAGFAQIVCIASLNTTLQVTVVASMRGRVMSMLSFALFGLSTLGGLLLGILGDGIGVAHALCAGGVAILVIASVLAYRSPVVFTPVRGPLAAAP